VHRNVPGVLGQINAIFSGRALNIDAQYLQTDGEFGYVVVDASVRPDEAEAVHRALRAIDGTVRTRHLRPAAG
jgi:D-3-phosphoglycerate dehydrogenase